MFIHQKARGLLVFVSVIGIFVFYSTYISYKLGSDIFRSYISSRSWPSVVGEIVESQSMKGCGKGTGYYLNVTYQYRVNNFDYRNKRISFGNAYCAGRDDIELESKNYVIGQQIIVYFNPANPSESSLIIKKVQNGTFFIFFLMLIPLFGFLYFLIIIIKKISSGKIAYGFTHQEKIKRSIQIEIDERTAKK